MCPKVTQSTVYKPESRVPYLSQLRIQPPKLNRPTSNFPSCNLNFYKKFETLKCQTPLIKVSRDKTFTDSSLLTHGSPKYYKVVGNKYIVLPIGQLSTSQRIYFHWFSLGKFKFFFLFLFHKKNDQSCHWWLQVGGCIIPNVGIAYRCSTENSRYRSLAFRYLAELALPSRYVLYYLVTTLDIVSPVGTTIYFVFLFFIYKIKIYL